MSIKISVSKNGNTVFCDAEKGESILSVLRRENIFVPAFCSGHELCGKCKVLASGALSDYSEAENETLNEEEKANGIRLACSAKIYGEVSVLVPTDGAYSVLTDIGDGAEDYFPSCWESLGAAIDLGTTTVAIYIYSLETRRKIGVISDLNRQQILGADVISRIEYCLTNEGGVKKAQSLIVGQINDMLKEFAKKRGVPTVKIKSMTVAGNTAMLYLLSGRCPKSLAAAPFEADELFGSFGRASSLGIDLPEAAVYMLPCISAFVGGDITSGILSSGLYKSEKNSLLIDFGTNGEMVLAANGKLTCCSTAAGPAFEGAKISCGVGGVAGAINKVKFGENGYTVETIGGKKPIGLAGSGLIDIITYLRAKDMIDEYGLLSKPFEIAEGVTLQPQDIREFQLAKSAVRAGAETLLEEAGISADELDEVLLTGGFGAGLDIANALTLGLLPQVPIEKVRVLGNCAGAGAVATLLDPMAIAELEQLTDRATTVRLDGNVGFSEKFADYMTF